VAGICAQSATWWAAVDYFPVVKVRVCFHAWPPASAETVTV
jgi:hypothetical protein